MRVALPAADWTVIATTGERFAELGHYVAAVAEDGIVAFRAGLRGGGGAVITSDGDELTEIARPPEVADVTSHPDVNLAGEASFYGVLPDGTRGVFFVAGGRVRSLADTSSSLASVGPAGPTMSERGAVAFRGEREPGAAAVFVAMGDEVTLVAEQGTDWAAFHGLPVVDEAAEVVFRADRGDGTEGIHAFCDGSLRTIVETGATFATLGRFPAVAADGTIAFAATLRDGGAGIFTVNRGGDVATVWRDGAFESYRGALIAGPGRVVGIATPHGGALGLFAGADPLRDRLLGLGDELLGSTVVDLAANQVSINAAGQLAVRATLADGIECVLKADTGP